MGILVTGGAGFAGSHICEHLLMNTDKRVMVLDRLSYAGALGRLTHLKAVYKDRLQFVFHDFRAEYPKAVLDRIGKAEWVIHNGAETHVERSIQDPLTFVQSNVQGTLHTLEAAKSLDIGCFIQVSTDEVHGPAPQGVDFEEDAAIRPSNPYSASKAGAEALAYAWGKCYRLPVIITRTMNLFGERQHPEKFVPMVMRAVLRGEEIKVHGRQNGEWHFGQRKWIHCRNQADAILFLLSNSHKLGLIGQTFHIAGAERDNLQMALLIATAMKMQLKWQPWDYHKERPGHDLRYSLSDRKIRELGWRPPVDFIDSLRKTVHWTMSNQEWLNL